MVPHVFMGDAGFGVVHTTRERFAVALFCAEVVIIVIERRMPPCRIALRDPRNFSQPAIQWACGVQVSRPISVVRPGVCIPQEICLMDNSAGALSCLFR